ncbi:heavy-metal-associated domain-containing protein [Luteimicrobium sp. NPDC057192]|uniref:heavy-metal-associated domain-containing protein n=1 Tax=Luteimicrobium sp. NPDC057192 TaxID=3346042 RepID=UPI003629C087
MSTAPTQLIIDVTGMTCGHCAQSVTTELTALDGVTSVDVALVPGGTTPVTITTDAAVSEDALRAAVDEAGYAVVGIH